MCPRCGRDHKEEECNSDMKKCNNCAMANMKYKIKQATDRTARDPTCPAYKYYEQRSRNRIDYGVSVNSTHG